MTSKRNVTPRPPVRDASFEGGVRVMHAVRIHEFGGPEVLKLEDVPDPEPGRGEASIRSTSRSATAASFRPTSCP
jgi:hypothetical protein